METSSLDAWKKEMERKYPEITQSIRESIKDNSLDQMKEFIKTGNEKSILSKVTMLKDSKLPQDKKDLQAFMGILKQEAPKVFEKINIKGKDYER